MQSLSVPEGTMTPPIVRDGIVYFMTNFKRTEAIDAKTGHSLWTYDYTVDIEDVRNRLPVNVAMTFHSHGIRYWEAEDVILDYGIACDMYAIDAKTGQEKFRIEDLCLNIPGNLYNYFGAFTLSQAAEIGTYDKGNQFIYIMPGSMHSYLGNPDSRHVTMGIDMDTHEVLWRVFSAPPQDRLTKDWALQECDIGYFHIYPCADVAAVNRAGLEWDFGLPNEPPSMWGGVTANWGQIVIDEDTGVLYTATGNQGPYSNMTLVPGPRLYGSTLMAIDMNQGQRIWWLQPFPHDPYDYDCNWSGILADNPTLGKVYIKGCKEGVFYVIDVETGEPIYTIDALDDLIARGQMGELNGPYYKYYRPDPFSYHDMREWNWISWPAAFPGEPGERFTLPATIVPSWSNGLFATDMSFDPETQTLFHFAAAAPRTVLQEFPMLPGNSLFSTSRPQNVNTSIVAIDLATGATKWTWLFDYSQTRAHMVISGGMVFTGFPDSMVRFFNKDTGELLRELNLGGPMQVGVTIGQDSDGNSKIFIIAGAQNYMTEAAFMGANVGPRVPGTLVAIGLSDRAAAEVKTTTVTTTTTSRTTLTTTTATTSTVTTATTSTVTSTAQASTTTVTSEITETVGLPATVTYAAVAVAVIAIIAAAVLVTRRR
jgi:outer membrane protein assembly factor BamB